MTFLIPNFKLQITNWVIVFAALLVCVASHAQQIKVNAKFNADSMKLGQPIDFYLSAHYPSNLNLLFPDSTFSFKPFELQKKKVFTTQTTNGVSKDSAIYTLSSYEIDSIQTLKLPVFVVNRMDCTEVFSNTDTIYFQNLVGAIPDSLSADRLPLKVNVNYLGVSWQLNYILVAIVIGILLIALIITWIIFGRRIRKYFRLKKLVKGYEAFKLSYENSLDKLNSNFSTQTAESTLVIWKKYLESLVAKPYTKYTSKEIRSIENNDELGQALMAIDKMIYGHDVENVQPPFVTLKEYVREQFEKKKMEVTNG